MPVYQDKKTRLWYVQAYYIDSRTGKSAQKKKRGFTLQRDAKAWERDFLERQAAQPDMKFSALAELYLEDKLKHTKRITYETKKNRLETWITPHFGDLAINEITAVQVREWQAGLKQAAGQFGKPLSAGYMQNLVTELSCVFNFAVKFYGLRENPCRIAGNLVGKKTKSLNFWTKPEFDRFIETFDVSDVYYTAFMVLYYCGLRIGELEALTVADVDVRGGLLHINKTSHLIAGKRVSTTPKTEKANRDIVLPPFMVALLKKHIARLYGAADDTRLFLSTHSSYARQMEAHTKTAGVKRIRLHDLRHSHASLLINLKCSAQLVADRLGHESVTTTLNIYAHLFPNEQNELSDRLEQLYIGAGVV